MKLARRDPFTDWLPFRPFLRDFPDRFHWPEMLLVDEDELRVDEYTEGGTLVVKAEMPGIDPDEDVELDVTEGRLTIRAERKHEEAREERNYYHREMHYGAFARSLPLPAGAKEEDIEATYADGILEVRVPMAAEGEAEKKTKIKVERPA